MTQALTLPVAVGEVYWLPDHNAALVTSKCSVCCGHGSVWLRNLEGEEWNVACEACGKGYAEPKGVEKDYSFEPKVTRYEVKEITRVEFKADGQLDITLKSTTDRWATFDQLYTTEAEALAKATEYMDNLVRVNMANKLSRKQALLPEHAWSVRYHNDRIKDAEKIIAWHRTRLLAKTKAKGGKPC